MKENVSVMHAALFRMKFDTLKRAYKAALGTPMLEREQVHAAATDFEREVNEGTKVWEEESEDGRYFHSYAEAFGEQHHEVEEVLKYVREAFCIALWHFWEKSVGPYIKTQNFNQEKIGEWLEKHKCAGDLQSLQKLYLTANTIKHSARPSASKLLKEAPDMFDVDQLKRYDIAPSYSELKLTEDHMDEFLAAVQMAFPRPINSWT